MGAGGPKIKIHFPFSISHFPFGDGNRQVAKKEDLSPKAKDQNMIIESFAPTRVDLAGGKRN